MGLALTYLLWESEWSGRSRSSCRVLMGEVSSVQFTCATLLFCSAIKYVHFNEKYLYLWDNYCIIYRCFFKTIRYCLHLFGVRSEKCEFCMVSFRHKLVTFFLPLDHPRNTHYFQENPSMSAFNSATNKNKKAELPLQH